MNKDRENLVRLRALEYFMLNQKPFSSNIPEELLRNSKSETEANLILNSFALIKSLNPDFELNLTKDIFPFEWYDQPNDLVNRRIDYLKDNL